VSFMPNALGELAIEKEINAKDAKDAKKSKRLLRLLRLHSKHKNSSTFS